MYEYGLEELSVIKTNEFIFKLNERSAIHITEIVSSIPKGYTVINRELTKSRVLDLTGSIKLSLGKIEHKDGYNVISSVDDNVTILLIYDFLINQHGPVYVELSFNNGKEIYTLPTIEDAIKCLKLNLII